MCAFETEGPCTACHSYGDCLDETQPLAYEETPPREDAPLKIIVPRCKTHRPHDYFERRHHALAS